ncbi:hypothetical protein DYB38_002829 [Aphanomyces astaci]|uniref:MSP domain-containing protein n=1 Tax=Aphanomyces astaci TaxID=112090 RepID=A0A397DCV7_APHAT|nr:hypothetical protein DYB34_001652 [Aphanomyces astaci]RHY60415.1 hypothetical protein DYB38_002829 [Aphanomyces astaci]RHZ06231.1 hypothetical protein DYB31_002093 [Aphanomyces astaci]
MHIVVEYMLDDGSGEVNLVKWEEAMGNVLALGDVVRVQGKLKRSTWSNAVEVTISKVVLVTDPNEEVLHWMEVRHLFLTVYLSTPCEHVPNGAPRITAFRRAFTVLRKAGLCHLEDADNDVYCFVTLPAALQPWIVGTVRGRSRRILPRSALQSDVMWIVDEGETSVSHLVSKVVQLKLFRHLSLDWIAAAIDELSKANVAVVEAQKGRRSHHNTCLTCLHSGQVNCYTTSPPNRPSRCELVLPTSPRYIHRSILSSFLPLMRLSPFQFMKLEDHSTQLTTSVPIDRPLFEPTPGAILFDEYIPFNTHSAKLSLRNNDSVARRIKILPPDSPFFKVKKGNSHDKDGKIAAGMEISFLIEFLPQERKEYAHDLVCCTEREKFVVPIRARGTFAALSIPDEIEFGSCPVKIKCSKVMTVHNIGTKGAKFVFTTTPPFAILPQTVFLDIGAAIQMEIEFNPQHTREREGELEIRDDSGRASYVKLTGDVTNLEVYLSHPMVEPSPAYISLSSRKRIKICNGSDYPVEFSWKAYAGQKNEQSERDRLLGELHRMELAEMDELARSVGATDGEPQVDDTATNNNPTLVDAIGILQRKYKNLRKAVGDDPMQFLDDCFHVEPATGKIWAHSETEITATFSPRTAALYSCTAFLDVSGRDTRLPLQIRGQGIGPKASILYDDLFDFGDVFINDPQTHDFSIQNRGEIPAEFDLLDVALPHGVDIQFAPSSGVLGIGDTAKVFLTFCSAVLGEISVNFNFKLKGSDELLRVRFRAHVIPPMFQFDTDKVEFGVVSFAFLQTKYVTLCNTSRIAMEYQLRIPQDGLYKHKEFTLTPSEGTLAPFGKQPICIDFTSVNVKQYEYFLVVSVKGVGSDLLNVPVTAQCFVPEVLVTRSELVYGECFLRYAHYQTLSLINTSMSLPAKYDFVEQDDHSKVVAAFIPDELGGVIPPSTTKTINVALVCEKLGSIRLPMHVRIAGSIDLPLAVTLSAQGKGPLVEIDCDAIDWGNCSCLVDHPKSLFVTNKSLIPASFKTFIRNARSKFTVDKKDCVLAPHETVELVVTANLDDTVVFKEQLHILVLEGANILIPLNARGTGTTMWAPTNMSLIDFQFQMTHKQCEWSCTLENKGKRGQILTWVNKTVKLAQLEMLQKVKALQKITTKASQVKASQSTDDGPVPIFTVFPTTIELKPRTACTFFFRGFSSNPGVITEELVCETRIGQEKNPKIAFSTQICAQFIHPKMETSQPGSTGMTFSYVYAPSVDIQTQTQPLVFTNVCELPLSFVLKTQVPFAVDMWEAVLQPAESVALNVEFYPGYKDDHISRSINGKLVTSYSGHPQKDTMELKGDICFPNLEFEYSRIDFGSILNDTQKALSVKVTNISQVATAFHWVFIEDEKESRAAATAKRPYIPINQVFDILPIRGVLQPHETESVEFIFYGHANRKFKSIVACEVEGGPEYELTLSGEASSVSYRLDRPYIDFGPVVYNKSEDREFCILNLGKVAFSFAISLDKLSRSGIADVSPIAGRIFANDKQRISVRFRPGIPACMVETLWLEVAHFQPVEFKLYCHGIFASLSANLPRGTNHPNCSVHGVQPKWRELLRIAKDNIEHPNVDAIPPAVAAACETTTLGLTRPNSRAPPPLRNPGGGGGGANNNNNGMATDRGSTSSRITGRTTSRFTDRVITSTARSTMKPMTSSPSKDSFFDPLSKMTNFDELDVDTEACRVLFVQYLLKNEEKVRAAVSESTISATTQAAAAVPKALTVPTLSIAKPMTAAPSTTTLEAKKSKKVDSNEEGTDDDDITAAKQSLTTTNNTGFILSQYILDFGNVVSGTHRVKKFLLTNTGQVPTSFQIDKNVALAKGFSIEPERVVRLLEKKSIEFTVTFQARKNGRHGTHGANIFLEVKNGPCSLLTLKANVTVPDIAISQDSLEYGQVVVGRSLVMHTQFHNTSPVGVEWSLKKPIGSSRDVGYFRMEPQGGVLHPGTRCNVRIEFIPLEGRLYHVKVPVKINANPRTRAISCSGEGTELRVSFNPPMAELGPLLPFGTPVERHITMKNESDYAIEVYSLDFDHQYKDEEDVLRNASGYSDDELLRLPLRLPGEPLPPELSTSPSDSEGGGGVSLPTTTKRMKQEASDFIILGPPCSGKSTQAKLLGEKDNIPVWTIDQVVLAASRDESDVGKAVRRALKLPLLPWDLPPVEVPSPEDHVDVHDKKQKKKKEDEHDVTVEVPAPVVVVEADVPFTWELLRDVLESRLSLDDMSNGSVLDGLDNSYLSIEDTYKAIAIALEGATILLLNFTDDMYESQVTEMIKACHDALHDLDMQTHTLDGGDSMAESSHNDPNKLERILDQETPVPSPPSSSPSPSPDDNHAVTGVGGPGDDFTRLHALLDKLHFQLEHNTFEQYTQALPAFVDQLRLLTAPSTSMSFDLETTALSTSRSNLSQGSADEMSLPIVHPPNDDVEPSQPAPLPTTDDALVTSDQPITRPKKVHRLLVLNEVTVTEVAPPLVMHGALHAAIEKFSRELQSSHLVVPAPVSYQLVKKPYSRSSRKPVVRFQIASDRMRWILPPRGECSFVVQFASNEVGTFDSTLGFEIVGGRRELSLFCRAQCAVPTINSDPRNVFMSRGKAKLDGMVQKKYVLTTSQYEFGPLLIGKTPALRHEPVASEMYKAAKRTNAEVFRISNACKYTCHLHFAFEKTTDVFFVEPTTFEVGEGDTAEVMVWAFPTAKGVVEDALVCCIADNPEPVVFPVTCVGCVPSLQLTGVPVVGDPPDKVIDFDRLLLNRREEKQFTVSNTSDIPVSWKLALTNCPGDFEFAPKEGVLKSNQRAIVGVSFTAAKEGLFSFPVDVEYSDAETGFHPQHVEKLLIKAEAYKIDVCSFEGNDPPGQTTATSSTSSGDHPADKMNGMLDFGLLRVGDAVTKCFQLRNRGKYDIKVLLSIKRHKDLFQIKPVEAIIPPGKVQSIDVTFQSSTEIALRDCKDIKCVIMEHLTGEAVHEFPVLLHCRAVFSKFRLQPARGLSFGSMRFNEDKKTKRLELRNDGDFAFKFRVQPYNEPLMAVDGPVDPKPLQIGQFTVTPNAGTLDPGRIMALDVGFQPVGASVFREMFRLDVSGRDVSNEAESSALLYELNGESCYPGINTTDMESLFEEQAVVRTFGLGDSSTTSHEFRPRNQPMFAHVEKLFDFGAIVVSKNVVERYKISNPTKVLASVNFTIQGGTGKEEEKEKVDEDANAFSVQPSVWDIPPHEHRYVNVHFKPTAMRMYRALFTASVVDGADPATSRLQFDVCGEGTMPCVTIESPTVRDPSTGVLTLAYGRVRVGKSKELPLVVRNDGIVPATVLFSLPSSTFSFPDCNNAVTMAPKTSQAFQVTFKPVKAHDSDDSPCVASLKLSVQYNPFEDTVVKLTGQGYREVVVLQDLQNDDEDAVHFEDVDVDHMTDDKPAEEKTFVLANHSADIVRFTWPTHHVNIKFVPTIGHVLAKSQKQIRVSFWPSRGQVPLHIQDKLALQLQKIKRSCTTDTSDWDDSMTVASNDQVSSTAEPAFEVDGLLNPLTLHVFAVADRAQYSCDVDSIQFKKTFMFQACTYKFTLKNPSKIRVGYSWSWLSLDSSSNDMNGPFTIAPDAGEIAGGDSQEFVVRFAPVEVHEFQYKLTGHMKNGHDHVIDVHGSSLRPVCHVDLEPSDYCARRALHLVGPTGDLGPLDPSVRVVEMESLGVRVRNTKRFYVINPTNISYEFVWVSEGNVNPCFRCATPKGLMLAGKRCEMVFEFTPQQMDLQEMFWRLKIAQFQLDQLFLFVGTTSEPRVLFDRGGVNFTTLLLGSKAVQSVYLVNDEHLPFNFAFDKGLGFLGDKPVVSLTPLSGVVPPHSRCAIEIEFAPVEEKLYNFNLNCHIKRKPTRLSLNIKGEGYAIHDVVVLQEDERALSHNVMEPNTVHRVDFGIVRVNETLRKSVVISNTGKFNFEFNLHWSFPSGSHPMVTVDPMHGTVRKNDKVTCHLTFAPTLETSLDAFQLVCTTAGSREYTLKLHGRSVPPAVEFSFVSHDFGACFIAEPDAKVPIVETVVLRIANQDAEMDISLDCAFEKRSHLRVQVQPTVLGPHEALDVPITFIARTEGYIDEVIPFTINGTTVINVTIKGEGIFPKIELVGNVQQLVNFGTLQIGQSQSRFVKLLNRAKRKTTVELISPPNMDISLFPQHEIVLKPRETVDVELRFAPSRRIPAFQEELAMEVAGTRKKLVVLTGWGQGMDVQLETETLGFGSVVFGSQLIRKVLLQNRGDLVAKFAWDVKRLGADFTIVPVDGVVLPNQDKQFDITFRPHKIDDDIRHDKIPCAIEGGGFASLTLTGSCVAMVESAMRELVFESKVRKDSTKDIVIENKTSLPWNLLPVVTGDHWRCAENLAVPAGGKATLPVVYCPLSMTQLATDTRERPKRHTGTIFFAVPDGSAINYNLVGTASEPEALDTINVKTPAKTSLAMKLPIKNWLKCAQVFHVRIENAHKSTFVQGADTITVPPNAQRDYGLKVYAYIEGANDFKVTFTNTDTGEFLFYLVHVDVAAPGVIDTFVFHAPVRQSVKKVITIENPFPDSTPIPFDDSVKWWRCSSPCVRVRRLGELTGRTEGSFEVEYRPLLHVGDVPSDVDLSISCPQLGEYNYKLQLTTSPAGIERILYFNVPLGGCQTQSFRFQTFVAKPCELKCAVQQPTFFNVSPSVKVDASDWDGAECTVSIKFEPEALGEIRDTLVLVSDVGGEYKCTLQGHSVPPLPQGPFVFTTTKEIEFKNVFTTAREFVFTVDNPAAFSVNTRQATIGPKSVKSVVVKVEDTTKPVVGKLLVTCPALVDLPPWVYYLEAETSDSKK